MIYFLSDCHLGLTYHGSLSPAEREKRLVAWLDGVRESQECKELFLVGDIFDFWFEWNGVIPKGGVRFLGALARLADSGVGIRFFGGNHDMWLRDYFTRELGAEVFHKPTLFERQGKKIVVAHGDGLGKRDLAGRALTGLFRSRAARYLFQRLVHPDLAMRFGKWWSEGNRTKRGNISHEFRGRDEALVRWAEETQELEHADYYVFGHLHTPAEVEISGGRVFVLGEWVERPVVGILEGGVMRLDEPFRVDPAQLYGGGE